MKLKYETYVLIAKVREMFLRKIGDVDIVNKHRIFSEKYLQTLCQEFDFLDSVQELRELIYNVPLDKDRRNDRPLSKLTQDILEEIENL